jgi:RimJ/RimL family protein N-acetyltransferase
MLLPRIHVRLAWEGREVVLRDIVKADLPSIADYWLDMDLATLEQNGVDHSRFGSRDAMIDRFALTIPDGTPGQTRRSYAFDVEGCLAGYSTFALRTPMENFSHWHILDPDKRQSGLSSLLYPYRLRTCFSSAPIDRLVHMTRPENIGVNRLLDRFVPVAETRFVDKPDGMSTPGVFNIRYVTRADLPRLLANARSELPI